MIASIFIIVILMFIYNHRIRRHNRKVQAQIDKDEDDARKRALIMGNYRFIPCSMSYH